MPGGEGTSTVPLRRLSVAVMCADLYGFPSCHLLRTADLGATVLLGPKGLQSPFDVVQVMQRIMERVFEQRPNRAPFVAGTYATRRRGWNNGPARPQNFKSARCDQRRCYSIPCGKPRNFSAARLVRPLRERKSSRNGTVLVARRCG